MPLYDFRCDSCAYEFERLVRSEAEPVAPCPQCGSIEIHRTISLPARPVAVGADSQPAGACGVGPPCGAPWCKRTG